MFEPNELPGLFDLKNILLSNGAVMEGESPGVITTSREQWAHSAYIPWWITDPPPLGNDQQILVRVEITVEAGRVGIFLTNSDQSAMVTREHYVSAAPCRHTIDLTLEAFSAGPVFVVRNAADGGVASRIRLHRINAFREAKGNRELPAVCGVAELPTSRGSGLSAVEPAGDDALHAARLKHLEELGLELRGNSVLEVSGGNSHLAHRMRGPFARVLVLNGRAENIAWLRAQNPAIEARVLDVELDPLAELGRFSVVLCYGLLERLENPISALRNLAGCAGDVLVLETAITDHSQPLAHLLDTPDERNTRGMTGVGFQPSPAFLAMALSRVGFPFVYISKEQPDAPEYRFTWRNNAECVRDGHPLRCVFVASRNRLENPRLALLLETPQAGAAEPGFREVATTAVWLDVGAHLGEKTFAAAEQNPNLRVYAFEPLLDVAARLMGRLPNFVVLPLAVAEQDGSAPFYRTSFEAASSLLPFVPEGLQQWAGRELLSLEATPTVPTIRLDTFLNQAGIRKVEYLKIDAQGADLAVIRSAGERLRDIERISLEVQVTPVPLYRNASCKEEVLQFLSRAGFELAATERQSHDQEENLTFVRSSSRQQAPSPESGGARG